MRQVLPREDGPPGRLALAPVKLQKVDQELPPGLLAGLACDQRRGHRRDPLLRLCALVDLVGLLRLRSEEHTSELQSLMRISYAVFCLKKKTRSHTTQSRA